MVAVCNAQLQFLSDLISGAVQIEPAVNNIINPPVNNDQTVTDVSQDTNVIPQTTTTTTTETTTPTTDQQPEAPVVTTTTITPADTTNQFDTTITQAPIVIQPTEGAPIIIQPTESTTITNVPEVTQQIVVIPVTEQQTVPVAQVTAPANATVRLDSKLLSQLLLLKSVSQNNSNTDLLTQLINLNILLGNNLDLSTFMNNNTAVYDNVNVGVTYDQASENFKFVDLATGQDIDINTVQERLIEAWNNSNQNANQVINNETTVTPVATTTTTTTSVDQNPDLNTNTIVVLPTTFTNVDNTVAQNPPVVPFVPVQPVTDTQVPVLDLNNLLPVTEDNQLDNRAAVPNIAQDAVANTDRAQTDDNNPANNTVDNNPTNNTGF